MVSGYCSCKKQWPFQCVLFVLKWVVLTLNMPFGNEQQVEHMLKLLLNSVCPQSLITQLTPTIVLLVTRSQVSAADRDSQQPHIQFVPSALQR